MSRISQPSRLYRQADRYQNHYPGEYPRGGAFHSTRHWLAQLMIEVVNTVWWLMMACVFGLAFAIPVIVVAILVK